MAAMRALGYWLKTSLTWSSPNGFKSCVKRVEPRSLAGPSRRRAPRGFTATEKSCQSRLLARRAVVRDPRHRALAAGADQGQRARTGPSAAALHVVRVGP